MCPHTPTPKRFCTLAALNINLLAEQKLKVLKHIRQEIFGRVSGSRIRSFRSVSFPAPPLLRYPVISFHGQIVPSQIVPISSQIVPQYSQFVPQKSQFVPHTLYLFSKCVNVIRVQTSDRNMDESILRTIYIMLRPPYAAEDEPSHRPILDPARDESSIAEQTPEPSTAPFALTFKVIEDSTSKGRPKLIDSRGYCYGVKRRRVNATDWICTRRPKVNIISFAFN